MTGTAQIITHDDMVEAHRKRDSKEALPVSIKNGSRKG